MRKKGKKMNTRDKTRREGREGRRGGRKGKDGREERMAVRRRNRREGGRKE